jgi:hypothetical protein
MTELITYKAIGIYHNNVKKQTTEQIPNWTTSYNEPEICYVLMGFLMSQSFGPSFR